jgi:hypothetical protein
MRSLTDFLRWLPGVAPRKAYTLVMEGDLLSRELKRDLHPRNDSLFDLVTVVGPDAAAAILQAYKDGRLPMQRGKAVQDGPEAEAYLRDAEPRRDEIRERKRRKDCVDDIGIVRESDFLDHHFMNRIFYKNAGSGPARLTLPASTFRKTYEASPAIVASRPDTNIPLPGRGATASVGVQAPDCRRRRSIAGTTRDGTGACTSKHAHPKKISRRPSSGRRGF